MALGDWVIFDRFNRDEGEEHHNLASDAFKFAIITSAQTPLATMSDPRWGAGGAQDLSTAEVTPGGNYVAGGATLGASGWTQAANIMTFDGNDLQWLADPGNPTNARWIIGYNDTDTGKRGMGFLDLGSDFDMTTGPLDVVWNALGLFRKTRVP